jgi:hypothetical protein
MSKNSFVALLLILVVAAVATVVLLPSDEKKINKNLDAMARYCTSEPQESGLVTLQKTASAAKLCTDPCRVRIASQDIDREFSRKEISDHILMMKKRLAGATFTFQDTVVGPIVDDAAQITATLRLDGETVDGRFSDAYELAITAEKIEGKWLFASFTVVEFIEK